MFTVDVLYQVCQKFKYLLQTFEGLFSVWQKNIAIWQILIVENRKWFHNNLAFWSNRQATSASILINNLIEIKLFSLVFRWAMLHNRANWKFDRWMFYFKVISLVAALSCAENFQEISYAGK